MRRFILGMVTGVLLASGSVSAQQLAAPESLIFIGETAELATARLLNVPRETPVLRSATQETTYTPGTDYLWEAGTRELRLTKGTRVPFLTPEQLHPAANSPNAYRHLRDSEQWMLYGPGRYFHDRQCVADYDAADEWRPPPIGVAPKEQLGKLRSRLKGKQPVTIVVLGDSISTEADASKLASAPPLQPGYPTLVAEGLQQTFGSEVELVNLSVGGKDSAWGIEQVEQVIAAKPHLLLVAFGMNDGSGRRTPEDFGRNTQRIIDPVLAGLPSCEVLLVSSMTANSEWAFSAPELYGPYARELSGLCRARVGLADVTTIWEAIDARKKHLDLTGNGLNHPNDYGHRLYAEVVLRTIGDGE